MGLGDQIRTQGLPSRRGAGKHPKPAAGTPEEPCPRRGLTTGGPTLTVPKWYFPILTARQKTL